MLAHRPTTALRNQSLLAIFAANSSLLTGCFDAPAYGWFVKPQGDERKHGQSHERGRCT
jgi:hypothetical protein